MTEAAKRAMFAMLAIQRHAWEQGVAAQALWECGEKTLCLAMAHDAVLRQGGDGRLALVGSQVAVTDPASNGEAVWRAYEATGDPFYREGAEKMLRYLQTEAPRSEKGVLYHNNVSFDKRYTPRQFWIDAMYMAPPFLAVMGETEDALRQIDGYYETLWNAETGLFAHIYDEGSRRFVRSLLWATGNGWALLGMARVAKEVDKQGKTAVAVDLRARCRALLEAMEPYRRDDGLFHDILTDPSTFVDGTSAMMVGACAFRGTAEGWLPKAYAVMPEKVYQTMLGKMDAIGLLHDVCGCPDFVCSGTSAEAQASFLMLDAWREKAMGS